MGIKTLDGKLHWQYAGSQDFLGSDPDEGIVVRIDPMWGGFKKRPRPYLMEVMEENGEHWLWKDGDTWFMDLSAVRKRFQIFSELGWLEGVARFKQNSTATHRDPDPMEFTVYREAYLLEKGQKIFLSHKGADKPLVRDYFRVLKTLQFDPWLDEDAMPAGTALERGILKGFHDSCAAVFFITPNFVDENYLATEVDYAIQEKRKKGDHFQIITIVFKDKKKKGTVPALLRNYVWKEPESDLEGLNHILVALPVAVGPTRWRPDLAAPQDPPKPSPPAAITLRAHDAAFRFMGRDSSGGNSAAAKSEARWARYWFKLSAFNPRPANVGLMDIYLHFAKGGVETHKEIPGEDTGKIVAAAPYCPDVTSLTLPSQEWIEVTFRGGIHDKLYAVADADEIYLTATSTEGEKFRVPLASGFIEK